jgi:hypothetical protein
MTYAGGHREMCFPALERPRGRRTLFTWRTWRPKTRFASISAPSRRLIPFWANQEWLFARNAHHCIAAGCFPAVTSWRDVRGLRATNKTLHTMEGRLRAPPIENCPASIAGTQSAGALVRRALLPPASPSPHVYYEYVRTKGGNRVYLIEMAFSL